MKKILLLGDEHVGKSAFSEMLLTRTFSESYTATNCISAASTTLQVQLNRFVNLQIWDCSSNINLHEGTQSIRLYNQMSAFVIIADLTQPNYLDSIKKWYAKIEDSLALNSKSNKHKFKNYNCLVLLNKTDLAKSIGEEGIQEIEQILNLSQKSGMHVIVEGSIKECCKPSGERLASLIKQFVRKIGSKNYIELVEEGGEKDNKETPFCGEKCEVM